MQLSEKTRELLTKLQRMAKDGIGGEKVNAENMLKEMMEKHGITQDMFESDERNLIQFNLDNAVMRKVFLQTASTILGSKFPVKQATINENILFLELTRFEEAELRTRWNFYSRLFEQEITTLVTAFVYKHQLTPKDGGGNPMQRSLDEELRVMRMMQGLRNETITKQLEPIKKR